MILRDMASGCSMPNSNLSSIVPRYILQGKRPKKEPTTVSSVPVTTSTLESSLTAISPTSAHGNLSTSLERPFVGMRLTESRLTRSQE